MPNSLNTPNNIDLFHPGQHLGGRYQVVSCLGRGGMGVVYHVTQMFVNKDFALKTIENQTHNEAARLRFQEEARTAFAVKHPNVIAINDFGLLDDQTPFLVMELIQGETLAERLRRVGHLSVEDVTRLFMQICAGVACAHEQNVVHRDMKPSNVMLLDDSEFGTEGSIRIVDFGIAKVSNDTTAERQALTKTGEIMGSPLYMSPEQCMSQNVDQRSDIYSLGCIMFESLTGTPPFIGENALTTMMKHQTEVAPSLREASLGKTFPATFENIVRKMLEKSPQNCYQTVREVMRDLSSTTSGDLSAKPKQDKPDKTSKVNNAKLVLSKGMFYGSIAFTILFSAGVSTLAAFTFKQVQKPKVESKVLIETRSEATQRAEEMTLPLDQRSVDSAQALTVEMLRQRIAHRDSSKPNYIQLHFKHVNHDVFLDLVTNKWIRYLDLESATFDNKDLIELTKLPDLKVLNVRGSTINDEGMLLLPQCKKISTFEGSGTTLNDDAIAPLAGMQQLVDIELNSTQIGDTSFKYFAQIPGLQTLEIGDCDIKGRGLQDLKNCKIHRLDLHNTQIDDKTLDEIAKLPQLHELSLRSTNVTKDAVKQLCLKLKGKLQTLYLSRCPKLTPGDTFELKRMAPWVQIHDEQEKPEADKDA